MAANFIDLKDVEGDRAGGIATLPVLLGMRSAQQIAGLSFWLCHVIVGVWLGPGLFFLAAAIGCVQYALITNEQYQERPVMALLILTFSGLLVYFLNN